MKVSPSNPEQFLKEIGSIVSKKNLITDKAKTASYFKGFRFGGGDAKAVVVPKTLLELWRVAQVCVDHDVIMVMQAANTGLTGGSTPYGQYDRDVVLISTVKLKGIQVLDEGKQVLAFPGSCLFELEEELKPYNREPHSVIGSSCIGASIIGGVCNNSGGALVQRGPAYTEMALYARVDENQKLTLVNHLGINLGSEPERVLSALENKEYTKADIKYPDRSASDNGYQQKVREIDADTPSRFNNDGRLLYEASGCAGKLIVFAVRLDTFPKSKKDKVFYIGTNDTETLTGIRREVLGSFEHLPISGEYIHRDYFDVCDKYGKDSFLVIEKLGSEMMPKLFKLKNTVDSFLSKFTLLPKNIPDKLLQQSGKIFPDHLPKKMREFRDKYEHHLMLHMSDDGVDEAHKFLERFFEGSEGGYFVCSESEGKKAFLNRFVAGGAAKRFHTLHPDCGAIMALDIALKRNETDWFEKLPPELDELVEAKLYNGHFMCHVMHQDYILKTGVDENEFKNKILSFFDAKGAEYPAEHNVGQLYTAKSELREFYRQNDPTNSLNPGIGKTSKNKHWCH